MTFLKLKLILNTVKYLKPKQIYYRLYYAIKNKVFHKTYHTPLKKEISLLTIKQSFNSQHSFNAKNTFIFLNRTHQFKENIDWNYNGYGKLWTYNLNYFDFLNQKKITKEQGIELLNNYCKRSTEIKDGFEPYPTSLRTINWIKFLSSNAIKNSRYNTFLYNDYQRLLDTLEYHILGNHLLENGFSLLFGAYFFNDKKIYTKAINIITSELKEQILKDGAHFERSIMYHKILLIKLLDCISLIDNNTVFSNKNFEILLKQKATIMLGFLQKISFNNDTIPLFNDAAYTIATSNKNIQTYAKDLHIEPVSIALKESGYRKMKVNSFEMSIDIGDIGPTYQPGHAHADTFTFSLQFEDIPIIVDTGTSTYNIGKRRDYERSTIAHNTVTYKHKNSSEVWGGFRVANRAKVTIITDRQDNIQATHNGYKKDGITHQRTFKELPEGFLIEDEIKGKLLAKSISSIHFHPNVKLKKYDNHIIINNRIKIVWAGFEKVKLKEYQYAPKFNTLQNALKIEGIFTKKSNIKIEKI